MSQKITAYKDQMESGKALNLQLKLIELLRESNGLTLHEMSERTGRPESTISARLAYIYVTKTGIRNKQTVYDLDRTILHHEKPYESKLDRVKNFIESYIDKGRTTVNALVLKEFINEL